MGRSCSLPRVEDEQERLHVPDGQGPWVRSCSFPGRTRAELETYRRLNEAVDHPRLGLEMRGRVQLAHQRPLAADSLVPFAHHRKFQEGGAENSEGRAGSVRISV